MNESLFPLEDGQTPSAEEMTVTRKNVLSCLRDEVRASAHPGRA